VWMYPMQNDDNIYLATARGFCGYIKKGEWVSRNFFMKKNKYNNKRCSLDGYNFASLKERKRYNELKILELKGLITELKVHPSWKFFIGDKKVLIRGKTRNTQAKYTADFQYVCNGKTIVEDVKSIATMTEASKVRIAFFEALYDLQVVYV
jgi:hypothetical protein